MCAIPYLTGMCAAANSKNAGCTLHATCCFCLIYRKVSRNFLEAAWNDSFIFFNNLNEVPMLLARGWMGQDVGNILHS